jgi:hypothetical protein
MFSQLNNKSSYSVPESAFRTPVFKNSAFSQGKPRGVASFSPQEKYTLTVARICCARTTQHRFFLSPPISILDRKQGCKRNPYPKKEIQMAALRTKVTKLVNCKNG